MLKFNASVLAGNEAGFADGTIRIHLINLVAPRDPDHIDDALQAAIDNGGLVATLHVTFDEEVRQPIDVRLESRSGSFTSTDLQRFPWARWVSVARDMVRAHHYAEPTAPVVIEEMGKLLSHTTNQSPGRRGRPQEFYDSVLAAYDELRSQNVTDPIARLRDVLEEGNPDHYRGAPLSRNTVATWVKRAKKRRADQAATSPAKAPAKKPATRKGTK